MAQRDAGHMLEAAEMRRYLQPFLSQSLHLQNFVNKLCPAQEYSALGKRFLLCGACLLRSHVMMNYASCYQYRLHRTVKHFGCREGAEPL